MPWSPSSALSSLIGSTVPIALLSGVSALLFYVSRSKTDTANALERMHVETISGIVHRADVGGDAGYAAIRAAVVLEDPKQAIVLNGVSDKVAYVREDVSLRRMSIVNNQLSETSSKASQEERSVNWGLQDSTGMATVSNAFTVPREELQHAPPHYEPVNDSGSLELGYKPGEGSFTVRNTRTRERIIGIDRQSSYLSAGTLLTVIGRATLDARGGLHFTAASGLIPTLITTRTLGEVTAGWRDSAWWVRAFALSFAAFAGAVGVFALVAPALPPVKPDSGDRGTNDAPRTH